MQWIGKQTVSFPNLGWEIPINSGFSFSLFNMTLSIRWYALLIAAGFLLALFYALRQAKKLKIDPDGLFDVTLVSLIVGLIGARLYYVAFSVGAERTAFFENPLSILYVWQGGLGIYGGIIFGVLTAVVMCRIRKVDALRVFDLAGMGFLIGQGIGRWGNFFNQEAFGCNTDLPWAMYSDNIRYGLTGDANAYNQFQPVHPTFLYESLWCLIGFLVLHFLFKKAYRFKGEIFSLYVVWYGTGRFFIEGLRTDSLYIGAMRVSQLVAVLSVILGVVLFFVFRSKAQRLPDTLAEEPLSIGEEPATITRNENTDEPVTAADETATEQALADEEDMTDGENH